VLLRSFYAREDTKTPFLINVGFNLLHLTLGTFLFIRVDTENKVAALAFASFMAWMIVALPPAPYWHNQEAYEVAFGSAWRVSLASLIAFAAGEFANSFVLAKMKIMTKGKYLWSRTIGSTIAGEAIDSILFYPLAFYNSGVIPNDKLILVVMAQFFAKTLIEVLFTPVIYKIIAFLKKKENIDYFDTRTNFNPFSFK
ncbi:MAG: hypothetical protein RJA27_1039, partial [Pseudomonadota bacterium]